MVENRNFKLILQTAIKMAEIIETDREMAYVTCEIPDI